MASVFDRICMLEAMLRFDYSTIFQTPMISTSLPFQGTIHRFANENHLKVNIIAICGSKTFWHQQLTILADKRLCFAGI